MPGDDEFRVAMPIDTFKNIPYIGTHEKIPGEAAIKEILAKMGKNQPRAGAQLRQLRLSYLP